MLAGPALLAETLVLVDVVDARAVHARVRLALVDVCKSTHAACMYRQVCSKAIMRCIGLMTSCHYISRQ